MLGFRLGTLFVRHAVRETDARRPCAYFSRTLSPKILEVGNYDMQRVQNSLTKLDSEDLEAFNLGTFCSDFDRFGHFKSNFLSNFCCDEAIFGQ